jgi:Trypsin-like peptidase domain
MRKAIFLSMFFVGTLFSSAIFAGVFIDDLRCMPVLIQIPSPNNTRIECGTGVYLDNSNGMFLVTAAHCIFDVSSTNKSQLIGSNAFLSSLSRGTNHNDRSIMSLNLEALRDNGLIKRHPIHDVAVIKLGQIETATNGAGQWTASIGVSLLTSTIFFVSWSANDACKTFDNVPEGSDSYVMGYPVSLLSGHSGEIDFSAPLIRKGVISQKNQKTRKLIIDSAVFGGNSGGPVLIVETPSITETDFRLVGIVTQYVPNITPVNLSLGVTNSALANSGYGVAEPIDYALELMRQFH